MPRREVNLQISLNCVTNSGSKYFKLSEYVDIRFAETALRSKSVFYEFLNISFKKVQDLGDFSVEYLTTTTILYYSTAANPPNNMNIVRFCLPFRSVRACKSKLSHSPCFIDTFIDYSSRIINLILDVLMCGNSLYSFARLHFDSPKVLLTIWHNS